MPPNANTTNIPSSLKVGDPFHQKFLDMLKSNNIKDEVKEIVVHNPEELKGEHFGGATLYVKVTFKDDSVKDLNLFAKQTNNEMMRDGTIKESAFYTQFLPQARDFCKNNYKGSEGLLNCFPKCWYGDDDLLVLDNLVLNDNWVLNKMKGEGQDLPMAKMVLKNLAGFHAASYAFFEEECGGFDKAETDVMPQLFLEIFLKDGDIMIQKMTESGLTNSVNLLQTYASKLEEGSISSNSPNQHAEVRDAIKILQDVSLAGKICPQIISSMKRKPQDKFVVLNHGDFHNNNMLFKKDGKQVTDNIFVDLQCPRACTPSIDIAYYLYSSVNGDVRRAHFQELLQHYYDTLQENLALLGGRKCPWKFSEFYEDFKCSSPLGFIMALQVAVMMNALSGIDASELGGGEVDMMAIVMEHIRKWIQNNQQKAMELVGEILETVKEYKKFGGFDLLIN